jgi:hypothetical protein
LNAAAYDSLDVKTRKSERVFPSSCSTRMAGSSPSSTARTKRMSPSSALTVNIVLLAIAASTSPSSARISIRPETSVR